MSLLLALSSSWRSLAQNIAQSCVKPDDGPYDTSMCGLLWSVFISHVHVHMFITLLLLFYCRLARLHSQRTLMAGEKVVRVATVALSCVACCVFGLCLFCWSFCEESCVHISMVVDACCHMRLSSSGEQEGFRSMMMRPNLVLILKCLSCLHAAAPPIRELLTSVYIHQWVVAGSLTCMFLLIVYVFICFVVFRMGLHMIHKLVC